VREGALSTPEQINFENVHVCSMELAAFVAIFAQSRLTFLIFPFDAFVQY